MSARSTRGTGLVETPTWNVFSGFAPPAEQSLSWACIDAWIAAGLTGFEAACADFEAEVEAWQVRLARSGGEPGFSDWSSFRPLRTSREEDWSDWLSYLLVASKTGDLARSLLGPTLSPPSCSYLPVSATREELTADRARRADIVLSWFGGLKTCIEVKVGDCNFAKTDETARGVNATWSMILLPPEHVALWTDVIDAQTFTKVRTWREVARALRTSLWAGREPVTWLVWAGGLLGKIEQEILCLPPLKVGQVAADIRDHIARYERFQLMREARHHDE